MASAEAAVDRLCDPAAEVSAHYLIARGGAVVPLVPEHLRAWHAGAGEWRGLDDINSRSIGIELDNNGRSPFSAPMMDALEVLLRAILDRWDILPSGVIGHSDMAPGRKVDPGPKFDWRRLERQGLAQRPGGHAGSVSKTEAEFQKLAARAGYTADVEFETLLEAVRLRYRPWGAGALRPEDFADLPFRKIALNRNPQQA